MDPILKMNLYHERLDSERHQIVKNTKPEQLTVGLERKEGVSKLISYFKLNTFVELGVREAWFSTYIVYNTRIYHTKGIDITYCENAVELQNKAPHSYQFIQEDSLKAHKLFRDESIHTLYVDDNHRFSHVRKEIRLWWPKIVPNGLMIFDDYMQGYVCPHEGVFGVTDALLEFAQENKLQIYLIGSTELNHQKQIDMSEQCGIQNTRKSQGFSNTFKEPCQAFIIKK